MGIKQDRINSLKSICKRISTLGYNDLCKEFPELYQKKIEADTAFSPDDINIENRLSKTEIQNVTAEDKEQVKTVLTDLKKQDFIFKSSDIERLNLFTNRIDFVLRGTSPSGAGLNNRINNIYNDREINGRKISIVQLFNEIKESESWKSFEASSKLPKEFWNKGLGFQPLLPYLYSLIKNCQDKNTFPLFYKQWQLEAQFFFNIPIFDYDEFCIHYRSLNSLGSPKLLNFSIYYFLLLEKLKTDFEYITLTKDEENKNKIDELIFIDKKPNILNIENHTDNMQNIKKEFIEWFLKTPKYTQLNTYDKVDSELEAYNKFFDRDIFATSSQTFEELIKYLQDEFKQNEAFRAYSSNRSNDRPAAILGKNNYFLFLKDLFSNKPTPSQSIFSAPLNKILYGPPGTGKTYNTLLLAAQIIKRTNDLNYDTAKVVFNQNLGDKIEFITFHQNYSYEDFIQGLRPDVEVKGNLSFERKDGVFARIAINALFEYFKIYSNRKRKLKTTDQNLDVNEVYLSFFNFLKSNPNQIFKTKTGSDLIIKSYSERKCLRFSHSDSSVIHTVSGDRLIKLYEKFPAIEQIKNVHKDITEVLGGCNATVYWTALNEFIKYYKTIKGQRKDIAEEDLINYEDISFEEKKEFLNTIELSELFKINSEEVPNYVIIIDEINRANISRVFGELITLIEPDKRSHGELPLKCTLPSGEEFIVPSNLYIIGTMNTADKSIALLDIALRRRFEFQAMYPDYEIEGIYDLEILKKINSKIIELKGYDFQIGHSYFMNSKDDKYNLTKRMNKKVIPLLLEYFMNNREEVEKIISHSGLTLKNGSWPLEITD